LISAESVFVDAFESNMERLYRARADAQSASSGEPVSPMDLLKSDILMLEGELSSAPDHRAGDIRRHLGRLERARASLDTTSWTESQALRRDSDTFGLGRPLPVTGTGKDYREYRFHPSRRLRVRILHPDPPEWKSGVDLIYECYWNRQPQHSSSPRSTGRLMVRVAALQYKRWDGRQIYLSSDPRLATQLDRAETAFCKMGLCKKGTIAPRRYGLPHCSSFLRPTDIRQAGGRFSVTHGWHVPTCAARRELGRVKTAPRIESRRISSSSVSQTVFAELFNKNMLGSRWISAARLERIYKSVGILDGSDRVVVHAQEYD